MTDAIYDVYDELMRLGECTSRSQFSTEWLGKNQSYFRGIQSKGLRVSLPAHAHLTAKLRDKGVHYNKSSHPKLLPLGTACLMLYDQCLNALLSRAVMDEMDLDRLCRED